MTGCFPSNTYESLGLCNHGVPTNIGCAWCKYEDENMSPMATQIHLLTEMVYGLEKRIEKLEGLK